MFKSADIVMEVVIVHPQQSATKAVQQWLGSCLTIERLKVAESTSVWQLLIEAPQIKVIPFQEQPTIFWICDELHVEFLGNLFAKP